jgi:hypothetical protein
MGWRETREVSGEVSGDDAGDRRRKAIARAAVRGVAKHARHATYLSVVLDALGVAPLVERLERLLPLREGHGDRGGARRR